MAIHVEISSNSNAAFEDEPLSEMVRVLRATADRLEEGQIEDFRVHDINGNPCGKVGFTHDD